MKPKRSFLVLVKLFHLSTTSTVYPCSRKSFRDLWVGEVLTLFLGAFFFSISSIACPLKVGVLAALGLFMFTVYIS